MFVVEQQLIFLNITFFLKRVCFIFAVSSWMQKPEISKKVYKVQPSGKKTMENVKSQFSVWQEVMCVGFCITLKLLMEFILVIYIFCSCKWFHKKAQQVTGPIGPSSCHNGEISKTYSLFSKNYCWNLLIIIILNWIVLKLRLWFCGKKNYTNLHDFKETVVDFMKCVIVLMTSISLL